MKKLTKNTHLNSSTIYIKNIRLFLDFLKTFIHVFHKELIHIDFTNKINILFDNDFYQFITEKYTDSKSFFTIKNHYIQHKYEYKKSIFYFILILLLNKKPYITNINTKKSIFVFMDKRLTMKEVYRMIYLGYFLDEIQYIIVPSNEFNNLERDMIDITKYYKYMKEYMDIFFHENLKNEMNNIYKKIDFVESNIRSSYERTISKCKNRLILYYINREDQWKYQIYNSNSKKDYEIKTNYKDIKTGIDYHIQSIIQYKDINKNKLYKKKFYLDEEMYIVKKIDEKTETNAVYFWVESNSLKIIKKTKSKINNLIINNNNTNFNIERIDIKDTDINKLNIKSVQIITVAKVGSSDFSYSLIDKPNLILYHGHSLKLMRELMLVNKDTLFIVGIRNPIDRNMSYFFQTFKGQFYNDVKTEKNNYIGEYEFYGPYERILEYNIPFLIDLFYKKKIHNTFNDWFREFFEITHINKVSFDKDKGIDLYRIKNNNYILLYTLEKLNENEDKICKFLDIPELKKENISNEKIYADKYKEFKSKIKIPKYYKDRFLKTDIINYFYNQNDIDDFYNKYPTNNNSNIKYLI